MRKLKCIVLARGGSKGVPGKNIKPLLGIPLLGWVLNEARKCRMIDEFWVSTDCDKIAEVAKSYGAKVIIRPNEISGDDSLDVDAFVHALPFMGECDDIVHLRATTPVIDSGVVDDAIRYFLNNRENCTSLRSGHKMSESIYKFFKLNDSFFEPISEGHHLGRQNVESTYIPNGYVDIIKVETILKTKTLHGDKILAFETEHVVEIDTLEDFEYLEYKMKNK
jgi:CMP-N,N'-diacetyllegionaminic acid synthase